VVLAAASFSELKLKRFLKEFFHKDHNMVDPIKVIIVMNKKPTKDIHDLIMAYEDSMHILVGNIFNETTIEKANIKNCEALFLVSN
jgi:hypothetical protein